MINRLSSSVYWLIVILIIFAGCQHQYDDEDVSVLTPLIPLNDPNFVVPGYVSRIIEAAGGQRAWAETESIRFDCVVTFYRPDGTFYLTEHNYRIEPWSNSIRISADEPQYKFVWQLSNGKFDILEGAERANPLPVEISPCRFADAVLNITAAPARLLDAKAEFKKAPTPARIEGQWYHPFERTDIITGTYVEQYVEPRWSKAVFYQNRDNLLVDMIWFAVADEEKFFAVRGYDYRRTKKQSVLIPAKIEIFRADAKAGLRERLVKIDLKAD